MKCFYASGVCKSSLGERMVKYKQRVSVSNFIMYHAYKNIKIRSKCVKIQPKKDMNLYWFNESLLAKNKKQTSLKNRSKIESKEDENFRFNNI